MPSKSAATHVRHLPAELVGFGVLGLRLRPRR